jgi:capsid protein
MGWWPFTRRSKRTGAVAHTVVVRAKFDSAQTNADNRRHWANADGLSADGAASPGVRRILRNRARYEVANNSYARGIVLTLANDVVGTGPQLQMLSDGSTGLAAGSAEVNQAVEREFAAWAKAAPHGIAIDRRSGGAAGRRQRTDEARLLEQVFLAAKPSLPGECWGGWPKGRQCEFRPEVPPAAHRRRVRPTC